MRTLMTRLWNDDGGALIATDWLFLATIMIIGLVVGLVNVRDYVVAELSEFGQSVGALDQSYSFDGIGFGDGVSNYTHGSAAIDQHPDQQAATGTHGGTFDRSFNPFNPTNIDDSPGF